MHTMSLDDERNEDEDLDEQERLRDAGKIELRTSPYPPLDVARWEREEYEAAMTRYEDQERRRDERRKRGW